MKKLLLVGALVLGFQLNANAQSAQAYTDAAAGAAQAAAMHANTAVAYQSYANWPVVGPAYASIARQSATSAVIAAQTSISLAQAAVASGPNSSQMNSIQRSVNTAVNANTTGTSILSGSSACGTKGEGCPIEQ